MNSKPALALAARSGDWQFKFKPKRDNLNDVLDVVKQALQEPLLNEAEFNVQKNSTLTTLETGLSDPQSVWR